ncbi:TPA: hypothetical protein ACGXKS_005664 [Bacillus cereus]
MLEKQKIKEIRICFRDILYFFFVLIIGTLIVGLYTEFEFFTYCVIAISINGYITNEFHKNETKSVLS